MSLNTPPPSIIEKPNTNVCIGGSKGVGVRLPPLGPIFFIFIQFFGGGGKLAKTSL